MNIINTNLAIYQRVFAVSAVKITDATLLVPWAIEADLPMEGKIDFIGPHTLHNMAATALNLGQSFRTPGEVLFINIDASAVTSKFIELVKEYQAAFMRYTEVTLVEGTFRPKQDINQHIKYFYEEGKETMTDQKVNEGYLDPLKTMTWEEAKRNLLKFGGPVRRLSMNPNHFIGYNKGDTITADKFWVRANKKAAERNGGSMGVAPYYTHCDGKTVSMGWRPTMQDELATDWVDADRHLTLMALEQTPSNRFKATYMLQPGEINTSGSVLFPLYEMLYKETTTKVIILSGDMGCADLVASLMTDMKSKLYNKEAVVVSSTMMEEGRFEPCNEELVKVTFITPGTDVSRDADVWNMQVVLDDVKRRLIEDPELCLVVDLKGFAEDHTLEDHLDKQKVNDCAVAFGNFFQQSLTEFSAKYPNNWLIVDMDYEANVGQQ